MQVSSTIIFGPLPALPITLLAELRNLIRRERIERSGVHNLPVKHRLRSERGIRLNLWSGLFDVAVGHHPDLKVISIEIPLGFGTVDDLEIRDFAFVRPHIGRAIPFGDDKAVDRDRFNRHPDLCHTEVEEVAVKFSESGVLCSMTRLPSNDGSMKQLNQTQRTSDPLRDILWSFRLDTL